MTDVSALAGCAALHTLDLSHCARVTDVSLAGCATLRDLDVHCTKVTDVSALGGVERIRTRTARVIKKQR